jgi:hypothetical protein
MPLSRDALDQLLDAMQEQLAQRIARGCDGLVERTAWFERCVEVIRGFAGAEDRAHVEARLDACEPPRAGGDPPSAQPWPCGLPGADTG